LAEPSSNPLRRSLPNGVVHEPVVIRTEKRWFALMITMIGVVMLVIATIGIADALHPASNVEVVDPQTLHLSGEFVDSNLGTTIEPDGSVTVRIIAVQYDFVPHCVQIPVNTPVTFRLTSADVTYGFLLADTDVNTMVVPGFIAKVRTKFARTGDYEMPCHELCGLGHHAWTRVSVVPAEQFAENTPLERPSCASP